MNRDIAKDLYAACERVSGALSDAEAIIWRVPEGEERKQLMLALGNVYAELMGSLRAPLVRQFPELDTSGPSGPPDTTLEPEDQAAVSGLTGAEVKAIDGELMAGCASSWRKVARVVGTAMRALGARLPHIPDSYYAQRVVALVEAGQLESQGNLDYMRYSEVRLPGS